MIILSFFTNLFLLFSRWATHFSHINELGVSQTSGGKSQPIILIVNFFIFLFFECECECDWVFWGSSSLLSSPTFSSVRVGGLVVVVGGCGGTDSGT